MVENRGLKNILLHILRTSNNETKNPTIKRLIMFYLDNSDHTINDKLQNTTMLLASAQAGNLDILKHLMNLNATADWESLLKFARGGLRREEEKQNVRLNMLNSELDSLNAQFIDNEGDFLDQHGDDEDEDNEFAGLMYDDYVNMIEEEIREKTDEIEYIQQILQKHRDTIRYIEEQIRKETKDAKGLVIMASNKGKLPPEMVHEIMGNLTTDKEKKRSLMNEYSKRVTKKRRGGERRTKRRSKRRSNKTKKMRRKK